MNGIFKNYSFLHVTDREIAVKEKELAQRLKTAKTVKNIRQFHYFKPINEQMIEVKLYSLDKNIQIVNIVVLS